MEFTLTATVCEYCGRPITRRWQSFDHARFCSRQCSGLAKTVSVRCLTCGQPSPRKNKYCDECRRRQKQRPSSLCVKCGEPTKGKNNFCSQACRSAHLRECLTGKKYRPWTSHTFTCSVCRKPFIAKQNLTKQFICQTCQRRKYPKKHEARARHKGVPYVYGIKPEDVFTRDQWRCQLCGCATPRRLRGTYKPHAPEIDHIVPIAVGGGHTWDNVQCACRKCNIEKRTKIRGQLRLAI